MGTKSAVLMRTPARSATRRSAASLLTRTRAPVTGGPAHTAAPRSAAAIPVRDGRERNGAAGAPQIALQRKLAIGAVNDPLEHEADRVAEQVMRMPASAAVSRASPLQLGRKYAECEEEAKGKLQKKSVGQAAPQTAPLIVHEVLASPGMPLDAATRAFMEPRFGHEFGRVRVHADAKAAESATTINASAYTVGNTLVFGAGEYRPGTDAGQRLLSHELMHVVQQSVTLGNSMKLQRKATPDDEKKKTEAVKKHEEQQRNVAKLLQEERGLATTTLKDPLDPHNVYRNTVELLDNNKIRLILLTPTHYSTKGKPVYFDTRVAHDRVGGDYPTDPATTSGPGLVHPVPGESGATLKITQPPPLQTLPPKVEGAGPGKSTAPPKSAPPPAWSPADVLLYLPSSLVTKDELRDLLIHEGQHVADWSHLRPATLGDSKTILEEYKTEFRAHWLQPGATIMSDEPLRSPENPVVLPPGRQCVACPAPAPGPGGSPAPPRTMETHLKNKKQAEIFRKLINEYTDDQFDCFYVCDKAFRDQVDAFDRPEGENLVNSARLVNLHIELQKLTPEMKSAEINKTGFLNAAESLDEIDWAFLTKESSHKSKRLSEPFWKLLENFAPKVIYQALRTVQKKADVHKALQEAMAKLK